MEAVRSFRNLRCHMSPSMVNWMEAPKHAFILHPRYSERNNMYHSAWSTVYQISLKYICLPKIDLPVFYAFIWVTNKHLEKDGSQVRGMLNFWTPWQPQTIKQQMASWCCKSGLVPKSPVPSTFQYHSCDDPRVTVDCIWHIWNTCLVTLTKNVKLLGSSLTCF